MRNKAFLYLFFLLSIVSCDYFNEQPKKLVGNFYIGNLSGDKNLTYLMYLTQPSIFVYPVDWEDLISLNQSDSILLIKSKNYRGNSYFLIKHNQGVKYDKPISIDSIRFEREALLTKQVYKKSSVTN